MRHTHANQLQNKTRTEQVHTLTRYRRFWIVCQFYTVAGLHVNRATFDLSTKLQQVHACSASVHKQLTANAPRPNVLSSIADDGDEDVDGDRNEKNLFEIWKYWASPFELLGRHLLISNSAHRKLSILTSIINNRTVFGCHWTKLSCALHWLNCKLVSSVVNESNFANNKHSIKIESTFLATEYSWST